MDAISIISSMMAAEESVLKKAALNTALHALDKQQAFPGRRTYTCPVCGAAVLPTYNYCCKCGQHLPDYHWEGL